MIVSYKKTLLFISFVIWLVLHIPGMFYGTTDLPLHMSYIGDEQAPVNGALHILEDKSILGLRNNKNVYYGPLFSVVALPAVALDGAEKLLTGKVSGAEGYKNWILWDWGGIVWKARFLSMIVGFLSLIGVFAILSSRIVNPGMVTWLPWAGAVLFAANFYFFEYSHFFRHWVFLIAALVWQLYFSIRLLETDGRIRKYWIYTAFITVAGFGISYLFAVLQMLWIPTVYTWLCSGKRNAVRAFLFYVLGVTAASALIIWWHPHAFLRLFGLVGGDITNSSTAAFTTEVQSLGLSFGYYARIIVLNHLPLVVAWLIMLFATAKKIRNTVWFWTLFLPMIGYYSIFSFMSHHESRYILPVIILLILQVSYLLGVYVSENSIQKKMVRIVLASLILVVAYHSVHIVQWIRIMMDGPKEREAIQLMLDFQKANPNAKTLMVSYYLVGYPHTKDAYAAYAERSGKSDLNLYKALVAGQPPVSTQPLNVYYLRPDEPWKNEYFDQYDQIIVKIEPKLSLRLEPDYEEVNLIRLWYHEAIEDSYSIWK